jgi:hypothetical protein
MPDESTLRDAARRAIGAGRLPYEQWAHLWGQPGDESACAVCDAPLGRDQLTVGVQFAQDPAAAAGAFRVHLACFVAWDRERQRFERR